MLKSSLAGVLLAAAFMLNSANADNSQQDKMKSCNAQAKTQALTGDARKSFMKTCLSSSPAATPAGNSQQQKMTTCNAQAKTQNLSGDARKSFMKTCLSAPAKS
jgi:hypothetical protein